MLVAVLLITGLSPQAARAGVVEFSASFDLSALDPADDLLLFMPGDAAITLLFRLDVMSVRVDDYATLPVVSSSLTWPNAPGSAFSASSAMVSSAALSGFTLDVAGTSGVVDGKHISGFRMNFQLAENPFVTSKTLFEQLTQDPTSIISLSFRIDGGPNPQIKPINTIRSSYIAAVDVNPVPLPAALPMLGAALGALAAVRATRRRRRA